MICPALIVRKVFLTSLIYEDPPELFTGPPSTPPLLILLPCFFGWMCQHTTADVWFCLIILYTKLVQPCYLAICGFDNNGMVFAITLIWYHKHRQTHTGQTVTNIISHTYEYMLTPLVICAHLYYTEWITFWYKKLLYRGPRVYCSKRLSLSCETLSLLIEMVKMGKTNTERKITLERIS